MHCPCSISSPTSPVFNVGKALTWPIHACQSQCVSADRPFPPLSSSSPASIYVHSGGLAEGYLDAKATAEKFVTNWFSVLKPPWTGTILQPGKGQLAGPESQY